MGHPATATLLAALVHLAAALAPGGGGDPQVATLSFAQDHSGTFPRAISGDATIRVDLSALTPEVTVYRAVLHPGRIEGEAFTHRDIAVKVTVEGQEQALPLLPPRFTSFDVTREVRAALVSGHRAISFTFGVFPGYQAPFNRLDVTCGLLAKREIPRIEGLTARHRAGQTILSWKEPMLKDLPQSLRFSEWLGLRQRYVTNSRQYRYRIYRSQEPITATSFGKAELVDEVEPLTGWDGEFYGISPRPDTVVPRYVLVDEGNPVAPGTAIYAHNPKAGGKVFYAVTLALDGEEDLSNFSGNSLTEGLEEVTGQGVPILQRVEHPEEFAYVKGPTLRYYVRWESPPHCNQPSRPIDYLVALPARKVEPAPVGLHLHCWGGSLEGGFGWWYDAAQGAILISTNQIPYDWWTGYHECSGTWRSWREGVVRDYTQARLLSFLDWAATQWALDRRRIFTAGSSMGGSGSPSVALRHPDQIAWCVSWVGVHRPAESPQFFSSYERVYGLAGWNLLFQDRRSRAFDYFDDAAFVRLNPAKETPFVVFANGKNDAAIGWEQAYEFWKSLQETRRPHVFLWGQSGHGQRARLPGKDPDERELGIDVRLDQTLPAFTKCTLDDDPGDGAPTNGKLEGQSNLHLLWETAAESVVDEVGKWSMVLKLNKKSPKEECRVDVTPRRCFQFRVLPGAKVSWRNQSSDSGIVQSGEVQADQWGLVTVPGVQVTRQGNRLSLEVVR